MANINKMSVRGELDRLRSQFERLSLENALTGESKLLMQSMLTLLELICAIFLEKNTPKTTKNSNKPSSQTDKDESALGQQGSKGKGKRERPDLAANSRVVETVTVSEVTTPKYHNAWRERVASYPGKAQRTTWKNGQVGCPQSVGTAQDV